MPRNSQGTIAVLAPVDGAASFGFSSQDTAAVLSAIPVGGTELLLPNDPNEGDFYEFYDSDGSCSSSHPITLLGNGNTIRGEDDVVFTTAFAAATARFSSARGWLVQVSAAASSSPTGPAGGDLGGTYPNPNVAKLKGNPLTLAALGPGQDGFVLTWVNADGAFIVQAPTGGPPSGPAGGDLEGTYPDPTIGSLQTNALSLGTLGAGQDGFVLTWVNADSQFQVLAPTGGGAPTGPAGGDLDGDYPNPGVAQIDGSPVDITDPTDGDVLLWNGGAWVNDQSLTNLINTVTALQTQVTNLSNGSGFNLPNAGAIPPNVLYEGTQLSSVTT